MTKKYAAVTGAAGGIGQAMMLEFLQQDFDVIGIDLDVAPLAPLQQQYSNRVHTFAMDLTDAKASITLCDQLRQQFGVPDVWVNNAGIAELRPYLEGTQERFEQVMDINFNALARLTRYWLEHMKDAGSGFIVNVASVAGFIAVGGMASYVASKFAVVGFTKSLQQEVELEKIPVNLVLVTPGFVETQIMQFGQKYGFPERLRSIVSSPAQCAQEIVSGILSGRTHITPTLNGKLMMAAGRLSPYLVNIFGKALLEEITKKQRQLK